MTSKNGNTPFVSLQQHQLEMTAVLQKVQEVLTSSRELQGSVLKATCDTLLSCATTYRSMKDIIQNHMFAVMVCCHLFKNTTFKVIFRRYEESIHFKRKHV